MDGIDAGCKDCADRYVGCHGKCEKYLKWKENHKETTKLIREAEFKKNVGYYHK